MIRVITVSPSDNYTVKVQFSDGSEGIADLSDIPRKGVFESWNDPVFFDAVSVDSESGTVCWADEVDLDPYVLYARAMGKTIEQALELV